MSLLTKRFVIQGKVQGVYFRASAKRQAELLNIAGTARNCDDGTVEIFATAEASRLSRFCDWLWQGPTHAKVSQVIEEPAPLTSFNKFEIIK